MSSTAARIGSSPLTADWSALASVPAGRGPTARRPQMDAAVAAEAWSRLKSRFVSGEVGFYDAPTDENLAHAKASEELAHACLAGGGVREVLILGIGGSALGPITLLSALRTRVTSSPRIHFVENPDAEDWRHSLKGLDPAATLVVSVTKSGTTFETLAQTLLALEWLGRERWASRFVAITDPVKGELAAFCREQGLRTLPIAPSIGGRFSVFSPVGIFPAALAGLSVADFLAGAKQVRDYFEKTPVERNALFWIASALVAQEATRPVHVLMPYSTLLKSLSSWWVQLWGESLGKDGRGFTPIAAVGATDQHSILQLLRDGPDDKVTVFVTVDAPRDPVKIPKLPIAGALQDGTFALLAGHSLAELLEVEYRAIARVMTNRQRPNLTIKVDQVDERGMGALMFALCTLTAFTGALMGVNPFDQPGVEEGKVYIRQSLSRDGGDLSH
ncbi:MAG: hypothetical protein IT285_03975 [Bdellovibrionales bacterium]|nr:hypothetical protein [Bdellovibrionales bacterium]